MTNREINKSFEEMLTKIKQYNPQAEIASIKKNIDKNQFSLVVFFLIFL